MPLLAGLGSLPSWATFLLFLAIGAAIGGVLRAKRPAKKAIDADNAD